MMQTNRRMGKVENRTAHGSMRKVEIFSTTTADAHIYLGSSRIFAKI